MRSQIALLLVGAALLLAACVSPGTPSADSAKAPIEADRILVAPLNVALRAPAELREFEAPIWRALLRHFQELDRSVSTLSRGDANRVWTDALAALEASGAEPDLESMFAAFASHLATLADYDLLVMPAVVVRSARVHGSQAFWDGARRELPGAARLTGPIGELAFRGAPFARRELEGHIAAASLHVTLMTPDGLTVYQGLGGLDVIQELTPARRGARGPVAVSLRTNPFDEPEQLRKGIARAFERPLRKGARAR